MTATAVLYTCVILLSALALHPYFAQTWDVATFIHAAHRFLDGGTPFDLYAQSRTAQTWPYAYPPMHALVVAVALGIGNLLPILPDYVWARVPALVADIGVAAALYVIVERKSNDRTLARSALLLWLFNPVTFYDTAVQGHFESEWLFPVLLAYAWQDEERPIVLPAVALAMAVLFKQVAIVFAIPLWADLLIRDERETRKEANFLFFHLSSLKRVAVSMGVFCAVVGAVCLPFLLYSNDFVYMNLTYVENVPVQTQSWIVAWLGLTRTARDAFTSDFVLIRYQTIVTMLAAAVIAFLGARNKWGLYLTATLIALAFFLTSKKVMGYYYVMLLPFLLAECLPKRHFSLVLAAIVATSWISLSPYYAGWGNPDHWWMYAVMGIANSTFFAWMGWKLIKSGQAKQFPGTTLVVTLGLFAAAVTAALVQPLVQSGESPIRAPIVAPGTEGNAAIAFTLLLAGAAVVVFMLARWVRERGGGVQTATWGVVLIFAPLFFAVYTLTKESTAIFEIALKALGG